VRGLLCVEDCSVRGLNRAGNPFGMGRPARGGSWGVDGCRPPPRPEGRSGPQQWLPPRLRPKVLCRR